MATVMYKPKVFLLQDIKSFNMKIIFSLMVFCLSLNAFSQGSSVLGNSKQVKRDMLKKEYIKNIGIYSRIKENEYVIKKETNALVKEIGTIFGYTIYNSTSEKKTFFMELYCDNYTFDEEDEENNERELTSFSVDIDPNSHYYFLMEFTDKKELNINQWRLVTTFEGITICDEVFK